MKKLEDIIKGYVKLDKPNSKGWFPCVHIGCDHGKKGPRAAFRFHSNGGVEFNCFNCPPDRRHTGFNAESRGIPRKLKKVLNDFGIPEEEWKPIDRQLFLNRGTKEKEDPEELDLIPKTQKLPPTFYPLSNAKDTDKWAWVARAYLEARAIDPTSYPFMLSSKMTDKWAKRLIIPLYKNKQLIYYVGRDITGKANKKYENPLFERNKVLFNFDYLFDYTESPLFIVEGVLDALSIPNCVAIIGNKITEEQVEWLNKSKRQKIYIPDRWGEGKSAALNALRLGWSVSTPEIGQCKDINDAVVEYGKLYVVKSLKDNTIGGKLAEIKVNLYCEN